MAGFRKAKAEQAALKLGIYGPAGSGKTLTALLIAEGLAKLTGKRIAYVDTENGTHFYSQAVADRSVHPEAFDFDAIHTRAITEITSDIRALKPAEHCVVVLDSMTHIWEQCKASWPGKRTKIGTIPLHGWGQVKAPYGALMALLLNSPLHVIMCGRQGNEYEETDDGELKQVGVKMAGEKETPYEPHIMLRMSVSRHRDGQRAVHYAYAEKDRTGVLSGRTFENPTFAMLCKPLLPLLGATQAQMQTVDEAAAVDAERMADDAAKKASSSAAHVRSFTARIQLAETEDALMEINKQITKGVRAEMITTDIATLRDAFRARADELKGVKTRKPGEDDEAAPATAE